jgi:hypothetical protein
MIRTFICRSVVVGAMLFLNWRAAGAAAEGNITLDSDGFVLSSPDGGRLVLGYPSLVDEAHNATKPTSSTVKGDTASVEYPQGVKLAVERKDSAVTLHFSGLNVSAKEFHMEMTLPEEFDNGGTWQLKGQEAMPFPAEFKGEQFVFKGDPKPLTLRAGKDKAAFTIAMPYGWHQIQDGRKWNSANFDYMFATAMPKGEGNEAWFSFKLWPGTVDQEPADVTAKPAAPRPVAAKPVAAAEQKPTLRLTQQGLAIEAGSMGNFTLDYPVLVGDRWDDVHKPIERKVSGNTATIRFDGGAHIDVAFDPHDNTLTLTPADLPASLKTLRQLMLIDFSVGNGGTWKAGDGADEPFPAQKPAKPHLYQGNSTSLTIRNVEGATLKLEVPPGSFQQLTDNREWGWKIFAYQVDVPINGAEMPMRVKVSLAAPTGDGVKLIDRFGQSTRADFPMKVKSEEELKQDVQTEAAWLASLHPPAADTYGGLPGSGAKLGLKHTGYFHVEKTGSRWILVDPEGNAFFHLGICAFNPADDYTYFAGRERIFDWLPPHEGEFASAFHPDPYWNSLAVSFHLVNTIRKTGRAYDLASYTQRMIERARKWGFNSAGAFGAGDAGARQQANFPYVASLPLAPWEGFAEIPGAHGSFDPFSDKIREHCNQVFAQHLPTNDQDPLLIGYFLNNEPLYEQIPGAVAALDASHPCKVRLAKMLEEKYKTIEAFNSAWETSFASFAEVAAHGLPVKSAAAKDDMQTYTGLFLDAYFRLVTETFHKYDTHHLLLGNRLQPGTIQSETLCRLSGEYLDLVSFNYYTYGLDRTMLQRVHGWIGDKPMFFSEFYFDSPTDSGLTGGGKDLSSQRERGLAYRQYVEQSAALGYVVGIEWFTLVDQATSGRFFEKYTGEAANTGLINVADRPYKPMIEEMIKTNYGIYDVFLGQREPFVWNDPRFAPDGARK